MKRNFLKFSLIITLIGLLGNCAKDNSTDYLEQADCTGIDASANTYTNSIKAILDAQCATSGCHDALTQSENINLTTFASSKSAFQNTNCLCSIHHGSGCKPMPDGSAQLSDAVIQKIDCWAKNGYQQ